MKALRCLVKLHKWHLASRKLVTFEQGYLGKRKQVIKKYACVRCKAEAADIFMGQRADGWYLLGGFVVDGRLGGQAYEVVEVVDMDGGDDL